MPTKPSPSSPSDALGLTVTDRAPRVSAYELTGKGYEAFWHSKALYRLVKGSKGSKKSKTAALWYIWHLMKYPQANLLCIRRQANTIRDSVFADLEWAMAQMGCVNQWVRSPSTMRMTREYVDQYGNKHTQTILFRGMDDPLKVGSLSISDGYLCWVWFEEFFEIESYDAFLKLTMSIRGKIPPETGLWKQYTMTFNPWSATSWIKEMFFDNPEKYLSDPVTHEFDREKELFTATTTYKCNEWLSDTDRLQYEQLYQSSPRMARIVCDGEWGIAEGLIYDNWEEVEFDIEQVREEHPKAKAVFGLDFGYSISYNAFVAALIDVPNRELWVYDEWYERGMPNIDIAKAIVRMGYGKETIWADAAEPKSISELQRGFDEVGEDNIISHWALPAIRPAIKGPDSVQNGIQRLQGFRWHVHPRCKNMVIELQNYCFDQDSTGKWLNKPIKEFDHLCDSLRYATTPLFINSSARVFEAKGDDKHIASGTKSRRVFSTVQGELAI